MAWNESLHPRDRKGRFVATAKGFAKGALSGGLIGSGYSGGRAVKRNNRRFKDDNRYRMDQAQINFLNDSLGPEGYNNSMKGDRQNRLKWTPKQIRQKTARNSVKPALIGAAIGGTIGGVAGGYKAYKGYTPSRTPASQSARPKRRKKR